MNGETALGGRLDGRGERRNHIYHGPPTPGAGM